MRYMFCRLLVNFRSFVFARALMAHSRYLIAIPLAVPKLISLMSATMLVSNIIFSMRFRRFSCVASASGFWRNST